jgi:TRAP-type C4-dicarboxylate transport system permease small subunit
MIELIESFFLYIKKVYGVISAIAVVVLTAVVLADIFGTLLKFPVIYTSEITGLMFVWITALSGVIIQIDKENIALTVVKDKFAPKTRLFVNTLINIVCGIFCVIMCKSSIDLISDIYTQKMALLEISKAFLYIAMTVLFGMLALVLLLQIILEVSAGSGGGAK